MDKRLKELGIPEGTTDHWMSWSPNAATTYSSYNAGTVICSCGVQFSTWKLTEKGKVGKRVERAVNRHIMSVDAPDALIPMGSVQKSRVRWDLYIAPRTYSGISEYAEGRYKQWAEASTTANNWWGNYNWAVLVDRVFKAKTTRGILSISQDRETAIQNARKILSRGEEDGHDVDRDRDADPVELSPRLTCTVFLDKIDACLGAGSTAESMQLLTELDSFLGIVPILQARREVLAEQCQERLTLNGAV